MADESYGSFRWLFLEPVKLIRANESFCFSCSDISTKSLITTLDVEEKTRAKDAPSTSAATENGASANVVVGKNNHKNKNKGKMQASGKPKKT
jgi:hypothetical protein